MVAFNVKLLMERGATFRKTMIWKTGDLTQPSTMTPVDITGYTGKMQVRSDVSSSAVLFELSTVNGRITLGGSAGTIVLYIPSTVTSAFTFKKAVYDLFLTSPSGSPSDVIKFMDGTITVATKITV